MKKLILSLITFLIFPSGLFAQDIILMKDSTKIKARVENISETQIQFRKYGNTDLSTYYVDKKDALKINFENGDVKNFGAMGNRIIIKKVNNEDSELIDEESSASKPNGFYSKPYATRNSGSFSKEQNVFSIGYGGRITQGGYQVGDFSLSEINDDDDIYTTGAFYLEYEHGITDEIGLALNLGYSRYWVGEEYYAKEKIHFYQISALGYYHFNKLIPVKGLDVYAGVGMGIGGFYYQSYGDGKNKLQINPAFRLGLRYYFGRVFGIYGEVGYNGFTTGAIGISFAFRNKVQ